MATSNQTQRRSNRSGAGLENRSGEDAERVRQARLDRERAYPGFEFLDHTVYFEGRFVGYFLGAPFDWSISSPELIWGA